MSGEASNALQTSIYNALNNDARLTQLLGAGQVRDWGGPSLNFPAVQMGDDTAKDFDGCTFDGQETTLTIHSWSQSNGRKEVKSIMNNVYRILHRANLTVTGQSLILIVCEFAHTDLDPDGVTFHGVQRFRAITQGA